MKSRLKMNELSLCRWYQKLSVRSNAEKREKRRRTTLGSWKEEVENEPNRHSPEEKECDLGNKSLEYEAFRDGMGSNPISTQKDIHSSTFVSDQDQDITNKVAQGSSGGILEEESVTVDDTESRSSVPPSGSQPVPDVFDENDRFIPYNHESVRVGNSLFKLKKSQFCNR